MSAKRPEPRSIASQLVFLFTLAAVLLLSCGLAIFYFIVVHHAFEEDNAVLADRVFALRATFKKGGAPLLVDGINTTTADTAWHIRLFDAAGRVLAQTPGMDQSLPPGVFPPPQGTAWQFLPQDYRRSGKLFSLAAIRAESNGAQFILQIAQDRSGDMEITREFAALVAVLLALGLLASTAIAFAVTKRGLRPLNEMIQAAALIGPTHLNERVAPARWPRELQPLARAFDDMLDRLEDSFTRLSQFSADLAHELRTPLANIRGEAEVALTRPRASAEYREVVESTVAECERLSGIVDNLLFLARAEAADRKVAATIFDARAAVEKIAAFYRTIAEEHGITIVCQGEGEVRAERSLFDRAFGNLLDNSLRFTSEGGTITISIAQSSLRTEVTVTDTGTGIPAEHLPRVFDRLYRADTSRSSGGAGLGLSLVQSIVHLHGGSAEIASQPGIGTKITLSFPAQLHAAISPGDGA